MRSPAKRLTITTASRKGGTGKTTTATGLGSLLASAGHSVLIVDLDTQSNAAAVLGVDPLAGGAADWLGGKEGIAQAAQKGLRVLAGGPDLELLRMTPEDLARRIRQDFSEIVIFDTPPGAGDLSRSAIAVADVVLACAEPHPLALTGAAAVLEGLSHDQRRALVLTRVDPRRGMDREAMASVAEAFDGIEVHTIRTDSHIALAGAQGRTLANLRNCRGVDDMKRIIDWIFRA
jgi:cellulose biosynthesis protein BcsQ